MAARSFLLAPDLLHASRIARMTQMTIASRRATQRTPMAMRSFFLLGFAASFADDPAWVSIPNGSGNC